VRDDDYQSLYDQLVTEWETGTDLAQFDRRIIETPKGATKEGRADRMFDAEFFTNDGQPIR